MQFTQITLGVLTVLTATTPVCAQISAFTYQGRLNLNGALANGRYDFMFRLLNDPTNGVAAPVIPIAPAVPVSNGLFTTGMDFGPENFDGASRWLEINVRTNGSGSFTTLSPRQLLTPTPYAIAANTASNLLGALPAGQISGTILNTSLPANPSFSGTVTANSFSGNGANLTNVNAATLGGLNSSNFWRTTGNAGTTAGTHFVGTTDNQPLEFRAGNLRAFRVEKDGSGFGAPNVIGGAPVNSVDSGVFGATIAGGGVAFFGIPRSNRVSASFGSIGGGSGNRIGSASGSATIAGGQNNVILSHQLGTISGGQFNTVEGGDYGVIAGGAGNVVATNTSSAIGGGGANLINSDADYARICGGYNNAIQQGAKFASIGGGYFNAVESEALHATVSGGAVNRIQTNNFCSAIGGGNYNTIQGECQYSTITGGYTNSIGFQVWYASIGGGGDNRIENLAWDATIAGGVGQTIQSNAGAATISGGYVNSIGADAAFATISGGSSNVISANALYAIILGGHLNSATNHALAAGNRAKSVHTGALVWGDSTDVDIASTNANSVTMRASGGYRLFTDTNATTGAFLAAGSGSWTSMSDRNAKENFRAADARAVLEKVVALPVLTWNYRSQDAGIRHIGPMAQDFQAAFGVGESDTGIATVDADGVTLAAIQGLNQKLEETRTENAELKRRLAELERAVRTPRIEVRP